MYSFAALSSKKLSANEQTTDGRTDDGDSKICIWCATATHTGAYYNYLTTILWTYKITNYKESAGVQLFKSRRKY